MQYKPKLCLLEVLGVMLFGIPHIAAGQGVSTCERSLGESQLDVNNVRARIVNTGGLFWRGEPHVYNVPKTTNSNAIFNSGIWIAGKVGGQLRASATLYGEWEMWAGPLDDNGNPPADCSVYDRLYKVSHDDIEAYNENGVTIPDLLDWPTGLGAPTYDANGDLIDLLDQPLASRVDRVIDLEAGERPAILGDQSIWWVMNDRGNEHTSTDSPPIGLEVHAMAFAFNVPGDIGNATFYRYNLHYKGTDPLTEAYFTIWSDPDLGNFDDDWIGSDTLLGLGYVYNSDNIDEGREGYGSPPPAVGYDFLQGPIVSSPGDTALVSGTAVPDYANLKMTSFSTWGSGGGVQGGPGIAQDFYYIMQGRWLDGLLHTWGGNGRGFSNIQMPFLFTGDPVVDECWTERNADCTGGIINPGDRRFTMSSGPFSIEAGGQQEIIFGVVFGIGADNWDSVRALRDADRLVQAAFDLNFEKPEPPHPPIVTAVPFDSGVTITWTNTPESNNYLESYAKRDPFAVVDDQDYLFEGYNVIQFADVEDQAGQLIATYDVENDIKGVIDIIDRSADPPRDELTFVSASGNDTGIFHTHTISDLTNLTSYFYGVQAYAYNAGSGPKILTGPVARFEVIPRKSEDLSSDLAIEAAIDNIVPDFVADANAVGQGVVTADIMSPGSILENATYVVRMYEMEVTGKRSVLAVNPAGPEKDDYPIGFDREYYAAKIGAARAVTYDIERVFQSEMITVFDGSITGNPAPFRKNVILIDGLQFNILESAPGMVGFKMTANGAGILDPPDMAAFASIEGNEWGFPRVDGRDHPEAGRSQSTNNSAWGIHVGGGTGPYGNEAGPFNQGTTWVGRSIREGSPENPWRNVGADDFEWRFTQRCFDGIDSRVTTGECVGWRGFEDGAFVELPFELWNTGLTPNDPSDDYRMLPLICEIACTGTDGHVDDVFDIAGDHPVSEGADDPLSDWIYWYKPEDNGAAPGEAGYHEFFFRDGGLGDRSFSRQVLVNWNGGSQRPFNADLPEPGSVIQYNTNKPNQPGDTFTFNTAGFGTTPPSAELKRSRLADINIVPNPYLLTSDYERKLFADEVRFSNLPLAEEATIRVFALNGTLVRTLFKPVGVNQLSWDLKTDGSRSIGSGIFLIHVEVPDIGTQVIKFAAIMKRVRIRFN